MTFTHITTLLSILVGLLGCVDRPTDHRNQPNTGAAPAEAQSVQINSSCNQELQGGAARSSRLTDDGKCRPHEAGPDLPGFQLKGVENVRVTPQQGGTLFSWSAQDIVNPNTAAAVFAVVYQTLPGSNLQKMLESLTVPVVPVATRIMPSDGKLEFNLLPSELRQAPIIISIQSTRSLRDSIPVTSLREDLIVPNVLVIPGSIDFAVPLVAETLPFIAQPLGPKKFGQAASWETGTKLDPSVPFAVASTDPSIWKTVTLADVSGDRKADLCWRSTGGIVCSSSLGNAFGNQQLWSSYFSNAQGFETTPTYWSTIRFLDMFGKGERSVCSRTSAGIFCAASTGTALASPVRWSTYFGNDIQYHEDPSFWRTISYPDLNGDGRKDVCGRSSTGVFCGLAEAAKFAPVTLWTAEFKNNGEFERNASQWATLRFSDIDGNGMDDICARVGTGIRCALSNGKSFDSSSMWSTDFSDTSEFGSEESSWRTITFVDINADRRLDVCGRSRLGIMCAAAKENSFAPARLWSGAFSDTSGASNYPAWWNSINFVDANGDKRIDLCGLTPLGVVCGLSNGISFAAPSLWTRRFSLEENGHWLTDETFYGSLRFGDLNGDGSADVCGRGPDEQMHCAVAE